MAAGYTVQADVVDLNRYTPRAGEAYLVDTNVWFWMCYDAAPDAPGVAKSWQTQIYPTFLDSVGKNGGRLHWSGLSWSELAHIIERTEFEIAKNWGATTARTPKEYRHGDVGERQRVVQTIRDTWSQVVGLASPLGDMVIGETSVRMANEELPQVLLDGYDLFLAQSLRASGTTGVITDDGDFCTVAGVTVFTANRTVLGAARAQGKLKQT